ncbi:hypothetical protein EVAR_19030_1 [Eumeta japonica]|uniref:Uncharacterized protein n=1 Tax=Eumeta variegata TaxID=151549 RepID=A0A4C1V7H5_EUMVA|nr:hypothetical protein EVAR_19030_1 [Eumeta japonica]
MHSSPRPFLTSSTVPRRRRAPPPAPPPAPASNYQRKMRKAEIFPYIADVSAPRGCLRVTAERTPRKKNVYSIAGFMYYSAVGSKMQRKGLKALDFKSTMVTQHGFRAANEPCHQRSDNDATDDLTYSVRHGSRGESKVRDHRSEIKRTRKDTPKQWVMKTSHNHYFELNMPQRPKQAILQYHFNNSEFRLAAFKSKTAQVSPRLLRGPVIAEFKFKARIPLIKPSRGGVYSTIVGHSDACELGTTVSSQVDSKPTADFLTTNNKPTGLLSKWDTVSHRVHLTVALIYGRSRRVERGPARGQNIAPRGATRSERDELISDPIAISDTREISDIYRKGVVPFERRAINNLVPTESGYFRALVIVYRGISLPPAAWRRARGRAAGGRATGGAEVEGADLVCSRHVPVSIRSTPRRRCELKRLGGLVRTPSKEISKFSYGMAERKILLMVFFWASTVHRMPGSTVVFADVYLGRKLFAAGQAYVAHS